MASAFLRTKHGRIYTFPSCEHLYGYLVSEFWTDPNFWISRVHADDISIFDGTVCDRIRATESFSVEFRFRCQDDQFHWMSSHYVVHPEATERSWLVTVFTVDISDLKQAAARDRLFDQVADGLCIVDWQGRCRDMNPAFCDLVGYPTEELRDQVLLHLMVPENQSVTLRALAQLKRGATLHQFEQRCRGQDGQARWLSWTVVPDLEAGQFYCAVRDVGNVQERFTIPELNQRQPAAQTLKQYERMVSATADGMALVGPDYTYRVVNQTYCDCFQRGGTNLVGQSLANVLGATLFETISRPHLDRALGGEVVTY